MYKRFAESAVSGNFIRKTQFAGVFSAFFAKLPPSSRQPADKRKNIFDLIETENIL